jgi:hypothetical protein
MKTLRIINAFLFLAFLVAASIGLLCFNATLCIIGVLGLCVTVAVGVFTLDLSGGSDDDDFCGYVPPINFN